MNDFFRKWNPAVPRRWLLGLDLSISIPMETAGITLAALSYYFGFSNIVQKNINRINRLPEKVCVFAFTAWRGYGMVGIMITTGFLLRNSDIPKHYLAIPYTAMGGSLVLGSAQFIRQFINLQSQKNH